MNAGVRPEQPDTETSDPTWFRALYAKHYVEMVGLARLLTGDLSAAEDLVQDAFAALWHRSEPENPPAYLRATVVNGSRNWHRSRDRVERKLRRHGLPPVGVSMRARELDATLLRLPYGERAVIVLRYWAGMSEAEIADLLGCRRGTVKSRHSRALAKIRRELP